MEEKNVYRQSAEDGIPFGVLLTVISMAMIYSSKSALLGLAAFVLLFMVPVALFIIQRRYFFATKCAANHSALWTLGMMTSIFGSLICGVVTYVWLEYVEPNFIYDNMQAAVDVYKQIPEMREDEFVKTMQQAIDKNLLPTSIEFVVNMIMLTTLLGSLLSLVMALFVRMAKRDNANNITDNKG